MNKEQIKEDQNRGEMDEKERAERGLLVNPDEQERAVELQRESDELKEFSKDIDERDADPGGISYESGDSDRNRGSSSTGSTDRGGAMREGSQDEKVIKGG